MKRRLKALFYGMTHEHAAGKFETLRRLADDYEIVAIADDRGRRAPTHLHEVIVPDGCRIVSESEAREMTDIDVVFIEVANRDLMEIAAVFAERGVPMHCDKPCGESMEPYRTLVGKCRVRNVPFQIGYMYRGNPALQFAWKAVRDGLLGDVVFIEADMNHDYGLPCYQDYISTFRGGILYNLGCHLVDMVLPMVRGEFREAIPLIGDAPGDFDGSRTNGAALLRFSGTDVLVRACAHMPGGLLRRRLRVDGTNGTLEICPVERFDGRNLKLEMTLKEGRGGYAPGFHVVDFGVQTDRYAAQLRTLAAIVRGDRPNDQDYDWDLKVHELTLRACGLEVA